MIFPCGAAIVVTFFSNSNNFLLSASIEHFGLKIYFHRVIDFAQVSETS